MDHCIQCNQCAMVCPHAAIRAAAYPDGALQNPPLKAWKGQAANAGAAATATREIVVQ